MSLIVAVFPNIYHVNGGEDISTWLNVGEVTEYGNVLYVMVNPNYPQIDSPDEYSNFRRLAVKYSQNPDGTGRVTDDIPVMFKDSLVMYVEYIGTYYADILLGKKKIVSVDDKKKHEEFMSRLERDGNMVVLKHDSDVKILDGVIKPGQPQQIYSNNSDYGVYFWGTKNIGIDLSNNKEYTYYCLVPIEDVYDITNDLEDFKSIPKANEVYDYIAYEWNGRKGKVRKGKVRKKKKWGDAIAITSKKTTPIWKVTKNK
jgi:hypothetical protein